MSDLPSLAVICLALLALPWGAAALTVTGISPVHAEAGSTGTYSISGTGFLAGAQVGLTDGTAIIEATAETVVSPTSIRCTIAIPLGTDPGEFELVVANPGPVYAYLPEAFSVLAPPPASVDDISVQQAHAGDTLAGVYVTGSRFYYGAQVRLVNGAAAIEATDEVRINATTIRCTIAIPPDASGGTWAPSVRNPPGAWVDGVPDLSLKRDCITVLRPTVDYFLVVRPYPHDSNRRMSPGETWTDVTISGENLRPGSYGVQFTGGTTELLVRDVEWNSTHDSVYCQVAVPEDAWIGMYTLTVTDPAGAVATLPDALSVVAGPPHPQALAGLPGRYVAPGSTLTGLCARGAGFAKGARVELRCNAPASTSRLEVSNVTWVNATAIRFDARIPEAVCPWWYDLRVENPLNPPDWGNGLSSTLTSALKVMISYPVITGVSPSSAYPGTYLSPVHISGSRFMEFSHASIQGGSGGTTIVEGDHEFSTFTDHQCRLFVPEDAYPGNYSVCIKNYMMDDWIYVNDSFTVIPPVPAVTGMSPASAVAGQTLTNVYVRGSNFSSGAQVVVSGGTGVPTSVPATNEVRVNATAIRCTLAIPASASPGTYAVLVNNPTGETVSRDGAFTVFALPPAVLAVPPGMTLPTDTNADGLYDDVNGNGRTDFADVVLYFTQMGWIAANEPVTYFDYNGNGRIDFADVVWLFNGL